MIPSAIHLLILFQYLQYKPFLYSHISFVFLHPLYSCFMITDIGTHNFGLFTPFVMNTDIVLSGLDCTLWICRCIKNFFSTFFQSVLPVHHVWFDLCNSLLSLSSSSSLSFSYWCHKSMIQRAWCPIARAGSIPWWWHPSAVSWSWGISAATLGANFFWLPSVGFIPVFLDFLATVFSLMDSGLLGLSSLCV